MNAVAIRDILERSTVSPYREMVAFDDMFSEMDETFLKGKAPRPSSIVRGAGPRT